MMAILFVEGTKLLSVDIASKKVRAIPLPRPIRGVSISHDGRTLYLHERIAEAHIWMMSTSR
jgi:hypothetical protein